MLIYGELFIIAGRLTANICCPLKPCPNLPVRLAVTSRAEWRLVITDNPRSM